MQARPGIPAAGYRFRGLAGAEERVELHVLARAYRAAWIALRSRQPDGAHRLADLGLVIEFPASSSGALD